ncbi:hypothetical protein DERF_009667 [Dermatophagoides farinae]|uniref:C2H2-type domain-containing protein n=1 Tax=Dermatophagoides farinae TaxID=6954 RepID=A0A922HXE1_DERFA|nr:hypothetical protein DERF_009667 [Dermatophagoides farinae]
MDPRQDQQQLIHQHLQMIQQHLQMIQQHLQIIQKQQQLMDQQQQLIVQQQQQTPPRSEPSTSSESESESSPPGPNLLPERDGEILKCQWPRCHKSFDKMSHYIYHEYIKHLS